MRDKRLDQAAVGGCVVLRRLVERRVLAEDLKEDGEESGKAARENAWEEGGADLQELACGRDGSPADLLESVDRGDDVREELAEEMRRVGRERRREFAMVNEINDERRACGEELLVVLIGMQGAQEERGPRLEPFLRLHDDRFKS